MFHGSTMSSLLAIASFKSALEGEATVREAEVWHAERALRVCDQLCRGYNPLKESGDQSPLSHLVISTASLRICYGPEHSEISLESEIDVGFRMRRK